MISHWVGGQLVRCGVGTRVVRCRILRLGESVGEVELCDRVKRWTDAVAAAKEAFAEWRKSPLSRRDGGAVSSLREPDRCESRAAG